MVILSHMPSWANWSEIDFRTVDFYLPLYKYFYLHELAVVGSPLSFHANEALLLWHLTVNFGNSMCLFYTLCPQTTGKLTLSNSCLKF